MERYKLNEYIGKETPSNSIGGTVERGKIITTSNIAETDKQNNFKKFWNYIIKINYPTFSAVLGSVDNAMASSLYIPSR